MNSYFRKQYDKTHGKARRRVPAAVQSVELRYGRHTTLASFTLREALQELHDAQSEAYPQQSEEI